MPPAAASGVVPAPKSKSTAPPNRPTTYTSPIASTASPCPRSSADPPQLFDHTASPPAVSFSKNVSSLPSGAVAFAVPAPGFKSTVPRNEPSRYTPPAASSATACTSSPAVPPSCRLHTYPPFESKRTTKPSFAPPEVSVAVPAPGSKSAVPRKLPATVASPFPLTARLWPSTPASPPRRWLTPTVPCASSRTKVVAIPACATSPAAPTAVSKSAAPGSDASNA